ncbi:MAG: MFS transporter [Chloroflexota bacterium]|nr:MFS transporter [Chloroflexota bacterium]
MARLMGLWRNSRFVLLWAAQTVSHLGSQISLLALPLTAVLVLGASPAEMGLLGAAEFAPWMLVGLFAGVWVDRLRRRPILVAADLGRALLLLAVPVAGMLGVLSLPLLYAVAFLVGVLGVFFEVAYNAFLPSLVRRDELVEGNSKLLASASATEIAGPGLAGGLVQLVTAPVAMAVDAVSYIASALLVGSIKVKEPPSALRHERSMAREVREGLSALLKDGLLRTLVIASTAANVVLAVHNTLRILYATRELRLEPALLGLVFAIGSVGGLPAALLVGRVARRFGLGPTIVVAVALMAVGGLCFPLAGGPLPVMLAALIVGLMLVSLGGMTYIITVGSLRQSVTPHRLQGRVSASARFISRSGMPVGSLVGGLLGEWLGLRLTLGLASGCSLLVALYLWLSPVGGLREAPAPHDDSFEAGVVAHEVGGLAVLQHGATARDPGGSEE